MTRKRSDPFAAVRDVIHTLASLTHDELRDLDDMLRADIAFETDSRSMPARHGLPPVFPGNGHHLILYGGWRYRDNPPLFTEAARDELRTAYVAAGGLPLEARALVADVARLLHKSIAPVAERRTTEDGTPLAEGTIQAKMIQRKIYSETGELLETREFGPYLYYRYLASGGGSDKRDKRLKNKYIGKQALAQRFASTEPYSDERRELERRIIAAFKSDALDALMLDMGLQSDETPPPAIGSELGILTEVPKTQPTEAPGQDESDKVVSIKKDDIPAVFLADYVPAPTRKQRPKFFALTELRREVLAVYASGGNYQADYAEGISRRKIARELVEAGLLAEVTGYTDHRKHNWRLTEAGLYLIRGDDDLQERVRRKL